MRVTFRPAGWYLVLAICLCLAGCSAFQPLPGPTSTPPPPVKLRVTLLPFLSYAPFFIAADEGYFKEQGLEIEWIEMENTSTVTPALVQGQLDVAAGILNIAQLHAMAQGARIKIVADKGYLQPAGCTAVALVARPGLAPQLKADDLTALRGLHVNANPVSYGGYLTSKILQAGGLALKDVNPVTLTPALMVEDFADGELDAGILAEPYLTEVVQGNHGAIVTPLQQILPDAQYGVIIFGSGIVAKNPEAGKRFMVAYLKAVHAYNVGKTGHNLDIMARHTELDRGLLQQSCWQPFRSDGEINTASVMDFQNWAVQQGQLDKPATVDQFWDPAYINYANQALSKGTQ